MNVEFSASTFVAMVTTAYITLRDISNYSAYFQFVVKLAEPSQVESRSR